MKPFQAIYLLKTQDPETIPGNTLSTDTGNLKSHKSIYMFMNIIPEFIADIHVMMLE